MAVAEHAVALAAVGAHKVAHVLHHAEHGHVHHLSHFDSLFYDHAHQLLRRGDDDNAVERDALKNRQRNIAGSGRHIHKHIVNIVPQHVAPKLLDGAGDHRRTPNDGVGLIFEQQVDGHHLNAGFGAHRQNAQLVADSLFGDAKGLGDRGTRDVGVQNRGVLAAAVRRDSQHGGDEAFADAALARNHADHVANGAEFV